jgi:hypothetical protein
MTGKFLLKPAIIIALGILIQSCGGDKEKAFRVIRDKDLKKHEYINVKVHRFDVDLFNCNPDSLQHELKALQETYRPFLDADLNDPYNLTMMEAYLEDVSVKTLYEATMEQYPDITFLEAQLTDAFRRTKVVLPDFEVPTVYTYVSGGDFEFPVKYADNNLIIALDLYLGGDYPVYSMWGIPRYVSYRMRREQIAVDCMKEIGRAFIDKYEVKNKTLLDRMIYQGKMLYFTDLTLPNIHDSIKIFYTTNQIGWANEYQGNAWAFFLEHDMLYTNDMRTIQKFMNDAPFTSTFSKNSPPRIGHYIGWQIVRECMLNNPEMELIDLFNEIQSQKILQLSKYKPKKK